MRGMGLGVSAGITSYFLLLAKKVPGTCAGMIGHERLYFFFRCQVFASKRSAP